MKHDYRYSAVKNPSLQVVSHKYRWVRMNMCDHASMRVIKHEYALLIMKIGEYPRKKSGEKPRQSMVCEKSVLDDSYQ